jgi:hypothetical protein
MLGLIWSPGLNELREQIASAQARDGRDTAHTASPTNLPAWLAFAAAVVTTLGTIVVALLK